MKVMNKTKEYIAIKVNTHSTKFFVEVGKYLKEEDYTFDKSNGYYRENPLSIKGVNVYEMDGDYILVDLKTKNSKIIPKEEFEQDYVELKD